LNWIKHDRTRLNQLEHFLLIDECLFPLQLSDDVLELLDGYPLGNLVNLGIDCKEPLLQILLPKTRQDPLPGFILELKAIPIHIV
jgi:hypothetical protein